ncbi:MAG: hypothetical protein HC780_20135 [Leptolyngbyaceae cyanobacterium CSU_1_3]|nr:hypothetical protein [Leptolyngbyaceae cyanobacterium CSU_1_3]
MTTLPKGFDYQGIYYYPSQDQASSFYYIPGKPMSQQTEQGNPTVSLMVLGEFAMLQLSSEWRVPDDQLNGLQRAIATDLISNPKRSSFSLPLLLFRKSLWHSKTSRVILKYWQRLSLRGIPPSQPYLARNWWMSKRQKQSLHLMDEEIT